MLTLSRLSLIFCLYLLSICSLSAEADIEAGKAKAGTCIACHGVGGVSVNVEWPSLAGQGEAYLYKQMVEFQAEEGRSNILMAPMIMDLTDQDMRDLSLIHI